MSKFISNYESPMKINEISSISDNDSEPPKFLTLCRNNDKSGDWNKDGDSCHTISQKISDDAENLEIDGLTEWKHRNVYSLSVPNSHPAYWSPRQAAIIDANKSPKSTNISYREDNSYLHDNSSMKHQTKEGNFIDHFRDYLADYQESNGTPRDEYSFFSLMKAMGQATGHSLVALFYIVVNISPLIQLFLFILRFILDKLISIREMGLTQQTLVKYVILGGQMVCIYLCLVFIFGFIVTPILKLVLAIIGKILMLN